MKNELEQKHFILPSEKLHLTNCILVPIEEYKELLEYKGRYLEIKELKNNEP